jgi:hypothetical protein
MCLTTCMQSPSREANSDSATLEIPQLLWKPEIHYSVQKIPPLGSFLSHTNLVYTLTHYLFNACFNIIPLLRLDLPSCLLPSGFRLKFFMHFLSLQSVLNIPPIHPSWFDRPNNIWWKVQIMECQGSFPSRGCDEISFTSPLCPASCPTGTGALTPG